MKVTLADGLFTPPAPTMKLVSIIGHARAGRHVIQLDLTSARVERWLERQSAEMTADLQILLDKQATKEAREPPRYEIVVVARPSSLWHPGPPQLTVDDALKLLGRPFRILLEDESSDRHFLMTMLTAEERHFIERWEENGYVQFEDGGGIDKMRRKVDRRRNDPREPLSLWLMFDSDALRPQRPSGPSERLRTACGPIPHYQLRRRSIENYLPVRSLEGWLTHLARPLQIQRKPTVRAFRKLSSAQRHHYNMKHGFDQDRKRVDSAGDLFDDVSDQDRAALAHGFGKEVDRMYPHGFVAESDLRRDSGWQELRSVMVDLFARIR